MADRTENRVAAIRDTASKRVEECFGQEVDTVIPRSVRPPGEPSNGRDWNVRLLEELGKFPSKMTDDQIHWVKKELKIAVRERCEMKREGHLKRTRYTGIKFLMGSDVAYVVQKFGKTFGNANNEQAAGPSGSVVTGGVPSQGTNYNLDLNHTGPSNASAHSRSGSRHDQPDTALVRLTSRHFRDLNEFSNQTHPAFSSAEPRLANGLPAHAVDSPFDPSYDYQEGYYPPPGHQERMNIQGSQRNPFMHQNFTDSAFHGRPGSSHTAYSYGAFPSAAASHTLQQSPYPEVIGSPSRFTALEQIVDRLHSVQAATTTGMLSTTDNNTRPSPATSMAENKREKDMAEMESIARERQHIEMDRKEKALEIEEKTQELELEKKQVELERKQLELKRKELELVRIEKKDLAKKDRFEEIRREYPEPEE
ncbi:hypothetical protein K402DRAFT_426391 [Aulographum hederae CBS 113979]|uniref:Uncharacterized protein n=1 Tax=Aulographum hederae CBS 113979 TaxID=1176131 RepID=A0A6G1HGR9_9PEZI|nr:hypothetical protein K402DRAFT_426391 [Aulographum hederae CBS 113979]